MSGFSRRNWMSLRTWKKMTQVVISFTLQLPFAQAGLPDFLQGSDVLSEKPLNIKDLATAKKGTVLVFVSAKCPCSESHMTELKDLAKTFPDFNFFAIHSNQDEDAKITKEYFTKTNLPFPVINDAGAKIADELKAYKTPHVFLMSPEGKILYQGGVTNSAHAPSSDEKYLRTALTELQAGKTVSKSETRTLGCVISRKTKNVW